MTTRRRALLGAAAAAAAGITASAGGQALASPTNARHRQAPSLVTPGLVLPKPWMALPWRERDAAKCGGRNNISEGWYYGLERGIHGGERHLSIDANLPFGAPILAPADGWAARTIHTWYTPTVYSRDGRSGRIGFGLGLWLITLHKLLDSDAYWWTKTAHVGWIDPSIKYLKPYVDPDGDLHEPDGKHGPDNLYLLDPELAKIFTPIKRGQILATVGDTGVEWGYRDEYNLDTGEVLPRDRQVKPAWDTDVHAHVQVYRRANGSPKPGEQFDATLQAVDPFGQYGQVRRWQGFSAYDGYPLGPGHQFLTDRQGRPLYAND